MATFFMVQKLKLRLIVDALDDTHQFQLQSGEGRGGWSREEVVFATLGNPAFDGMTSRFVLCFLSGRRAEAWQSS